MSYDIGNTDLRLDVEETNRDNYTAIQDSLRNIQEALNDIARRLEALE